MARHMLITSVALISLPSLTLAQSGPVLTGEHAATTSKNCAPEARRRAHS